MPDQDGNFTRRALHQLNDAVCFNRWMADVLRPHIGSRVLEIGAGIGNLTALLCQRELYMASDVEDYYCEALTRRFGQAKNVRIAKIDLTRPADFEACESTMDTVICLNVLEHLDDDAGALRNIRRALKPGGRLVLLVPQCQWLYGTFDELAGHRRRYYRSDLAALLASTGFDVTEVLDFNRVSTPAWFLNGRVLRRRHFGKYQLKIFDSFVGLFERIDGFLPWPGQSIIMIAEKGLGKSPEASIPAAGTTPAL